MEQRNLYEDIAKRTNGDIYVGVVGPVRTGKSTFIKRFMETLVLPNIENTYLRDRARDELPQSGSGRTIMTSEPKFVPEEAVEITTEGGASFGVRLIDCVGYMVPGAAGQIEGELPRMVMTPWLEHEIPMAEAAELGTRKVIAEHSTIGIVITTDGTISEIPREDYLEAEERVIRELKELGKPFVVLLNTAYPHSERAKTIRDDIAEQYDVSCIAINCLTLDSETVTDIIRGVLYEFPLREMEVYLPAWVDALPLEHPIKSGLYDALRKETAALRRIRDLEGSVSALNEREEVSEARLLTINMGNGTARVRISLPRALFYSTITQQTGFEIGDDGDLLALLTSLAEMKKAYDRVAQALQEVELCGYGVVPPTSDQMLLDEPEIVKQGGKYGVRLKASAPSIHMIRADVRTEVSPIMGTEKQSEEMVNYLLREFEGNIDRIWDSNIFGRSFHELVAEDLNTKLRRMPEDAREKLRETLQRIINEGNGGLICIIL